MSTPRSQTWSKIFLTLGAVGLFLTGILGWLNAAVVNGANFAELVNQVRQDEAVKTQIGDAIAVAALDAQPDLVAVEPAIAAGAAAVVGSPILDGVFTPAIRSFHGALTEAGSDSAVLKVADLGATITTALDRFVPQAATVLPANLNVTLAEVGGQEGIAGQIIPVIQAVSALAWVVPVISLVLILLGLWLAPRRRLALIRLGWMMVVVAGFLGLIVLGLNIGGALVDDTTLRGAVIGSAMQVFSEPLSIRFVAIGVIGGLVIAAAGGLLPQVDVEDTARAAMAVAGRRPRATSLAILRAMVVIAVGLIIVLFPAISSEAVAVVAGLVVLLYGVTELDVIAERSRAADDAEREAALAEAGPIPPEGQRRSAAWLIPVAAGAAGLVVLAALVIPGNLPQDTALATASAVDTDACNGHSELCDRRFDEVVMPASHNSMSVADGTWFLAEQPKDMVDSLDDGIRGLLVDTWYGQPTADGGALTADQSVAEAEAALTSTYGADVVASIRRTIDLVRSSKPSGPVEPYFCHTVCEIGATPMQPTMDRLNDWMDANPREVVVLFIQDTVTPADTDAVLRKAGLTDKAYVHPDGAQWPTLREMIESNKRLVVKMENTGGGEQFPYLHQGFDLVQDTEYTFRSAQDFTCTIKRGHPTHSLFVVNHWLAGFTTLISSAEEVNAYAVLEARIDDCEVERGRKPSMIAVNWYDRGDLFRVVDSSTRSAEGQDPCCGPASMPARRARSALLQFLGEHHDDAAGAADVGELVDVLVGRHAAQRMAAVPRGDLEGLVDVVDREGDAVHADLVGPGGLRLDRVGVDVLEELEATAAVRRLEHRDLGVVAVEADGGVGPLAADRVTAEDGQTEVGEEGDRRFEVADGDADVLEFDGHASHATHSGRRAQVRGLPVPARSGRGPSCAIGRRPAFCLFVDEQTARAQSGGAALVGVARLLARHAGTR